MGTSQVVLIVLNMSEGAVRPSFLAFRPFTPKGNVLINRKVFEVERRWILIAEMVGMRAAIELKNRWQEAFNLATRLWKQVGDGE
jgi:hypothetical protein